MFEETHTPDESPSSTGEMKPGSEAALLAIAKDKTEAGDRAGVEHYRDAADALVTTWKTHKTPQRKMAEALGKSQPWVAQLLQWHREGCPAGSPFLRSNISRTNKRAASKSSTSKRKTTPGPQRLFEAAGTFYKSQLAGVDDKTFDRVMKMFAEWRQAAKTATRPITAPTAVVKIGKETLKSLDNFSEDAKRQIAAAATGNDIDTEAKQRTALYAASEAEAA
jgi:hypothetical protein